MSFVDTNIFIRYLTNDDPAKAQACFTLFQETKNNNINLITTEAVVAEVVYVLSSKRLYNLPRNDIRARLYPLLSLPSLSLPNRQAILQALDIYVTYTIDFEDALIVAHMHSRHESQVYSYDRGFDKIQGVKRLEP